MTVHNPHVRTAIAHSVRVLLDTVLLNLKF
jgi:hypothetical protein